ncbi:MAG: hypothetical protein GY700_06340 [Propionibacteriaceae bacterium]|nr:hypothetical protein [Propionibacteriaceae bacterium]
MFLRFLHHPDDNLGGTDIESDVAAAIADHGDAPAAGSPDEAEGVGGSQDAAGTDFEDKPMPEDWPDELRAVVSQHLEGVKKDWQRANTTKRQAETDELRKLRDQVSQASQATELFQMAQEQPDQLIRLLNAVKGEQAQAQPQATQQPEDAWGGLLEGYEPDEAEHTRALLDRARKLGKQDALSEFDNKYGGALNQILYERTKGKIGGTVGEEFMQRHEAKVFTEAERISRDPDALHQAAAIQLAVNTRDSAALRRLLGDNGISSLIDSEKQAAQKREQQAADTAAASHAAASPAVGGVVPKTDQVRLDSCENTIADVMNMTPEERAAILASSTG